MKAAGRCSCCGELTLPYGGEANLSDGTGMVRVGGGDNQAGANSNAAGPAVYGRGDDENRRRGEASTTRLAGNLTLRGGGGQGGEDVCPPGCRHRSCGARLSEACDPDHSACSPCDDCGACCHEAHTDGCLVRGYDGADDDGESYLVGEYPAWDRDGVTL